MSGILVAGIGNVFLGDDGFGVEVAQRLAKRDLPSHVRVMDSGIRGFDLAFALMDDYERAILVDTVQRGSPPGTLHLMEPQPEAPREGEATLPDPHSPDPARVLHMVAEMEGKWPSLMLVGCEPADFGPEGTGHMGLSPRVEAAVDGAVAEILDLLEQASPGSGIDG